MLESIFHMTLKLLKISHFMARKCQYLPYFTQRYNGRHYFTLQIYKPLVVYRFYCLVLYHSKT